MISGQIQSPAFGSVRVQDTLMVGSGRLSSTAINLRCSVPDKATLIGPGSRQRFIAICPRDDPTAVWKVPEGSYVRGVTVLAADQMTYDVLTNLPTAIVETTDVHANGTPCGDIAFTVHRTGADDSDDAQVPIGTYVFSDSQSQGSRQYNAGDDDQYGTFFRHFLVNCDGHTQSATVNPSSDAGEWHSTICFRQSAGQQSIHSQTGAPVVYNAASRSLFGNHSKSHGVYIPFTTGSGLISDGTWGLAIGFVAQATYSELTGATKWKAINLDVVVHLESVSAG